MIDYEKFKQEMLSSIEEAEASCQSGPDVHSKLLEIIFQDMKDKWSYNHEALGEIDYVIKKVFPSEKQ